MKKRATLDDVARLAGVSAGTASYVISGRKKGPDRISPSTRKRVLNAVQQLNYVPNQIARDLQRKATKRICFSIPRLGVPTYDTIAEQIQDQAKQHGYHMIVNISRDVEEEEDILRQVQAGLADGLILIVEHSYQERLADLLTTLAQTGIAIVVFDNALAPHHFDVVRSTELEACYQGVSYLILSGRQRIACLAIQDSNGELHHRVESYYRALQDSPLGVDSARVFPGAESRQRAYLATQRMLSISKPPDAIFACTDVAALSAIRAIENAGLSVPEDIAVLGAGNIIEGELASPSLSTIGPEHHDYTAVFDCLLTRLDSSHALVGRQLTTTWSLCLREST